MAPFYKDPDAVLDFLFDWSDWLQSGESISSYTITVSGTGLVVDDDSEAGGIVFVWLSAGTPGVVYDVTCNIVTDNATARIDERTMKVRVQQR